MKKCDEIRIELPEYIDGVLDEKTSAWVSEHLETCDSCKKLHSEMRSFLKFTRFISSC
jgi:predicted anti-sigma-YlaC factor YlaD